MDSYALELSIHCALTYLYYYTLLLVDGSSLIIIKKQRSTSNVAQTDF